MYIGKINYKIFKNVKVLMNLSVDDFRNGRKVYQGRLEAKFPFNGTEVLKLQSGEFFRRTDYHTLPMVGFSPEIEVYNIQNRLVLRYLSNDYYTVIMPVAVIESRTIQPFTGFEPNKIYELRNGQVWQQIDSLYAPNHHSTGHVMIFDNEIMMVDNWNFNPKVALRKG